MVYPENEDTYLFNSITAYGHSCMYTPEIRHLFDPGSYCHPVSPIVVPESNDSSTTVFSHAE